MRPLWAGQRGPEDNEAWCCLRQGLLPNKSQIMPQTKWTFSWGPQGQVHNPWPQRVWVRRGGEPGGWAWLLLMTMMMMVKRVPQTWLLSVSAACFPRLDFSQHSIYYLADLLKVISEPSGPARWPEKGGASWAARQTGKSKWTQWNC